MTDPGHARPARWLALVLGLWLLAPAAAFGGGFGSRGGGRSTDFTQGYVRSDPWKRPSPAKRLESFTARRLAASRVRLRDVARNAERRTAELRLRRVGSRAALQAYARRIRREDDADQLRLRVEQSRLSMSRTSADTEAWWKALGPATRRSLERSGLELRRITREAERERRLADVERDIESRRPSGFEVLDTPELP